MSMIKKLIKKSRHNYQVANNSKDTGTASVLSYLAIPTNNIKETFSSFKTKPFLLVHKKGFKDIHIPMIPNWTDKILNVLNKYNCKYLILSPNCLLLLNYQDEDYENIMNDPAGKDFKKYLRPFKTNDYMFDKWTTKMPARGYHIIGYSYHDNRIHIKFSKNIQGFSKLDLQQLAISAQQPGNHYQFLQFSTGASQDTNKVQAPKFVVNADGSITNFSRNSNIKQLVDFIKTLLATK